MPTLVLQTHKNGTPNEKIKIELFHIRLISKHNKVDTLFDSGSQENIIYEKIVNSLNLEIVPHHKPYPLGWVCNNAQL